MPCFVLEYANLEHIMFCVRETLMSSSTLNSRPFMHIAGGILLCLCLAYTAGFGAYRLWDELHPQQQEPLGVYWEAWERIQETFYGELPSPQERTYAAVREALALLDDPYTIFVEPQTRELERDRMRGSFGGIGATLWPDAQGRLALSPYPDSPAQRAGVLEGDILLAVDGQAITAQTSLDDVRAWVHGDVGTPVTLTLSRPPTPAFDLTLVREEIQVPSVTWRVLDEAPQVGYLRVETFTDRTDEETREALQRVLQDAGASCLILDLRDNAGGLIDPAVATASEFLSQGVVLTELRRGQEDRSFPVRDGGSATDVPLVVLVNAGTASAAEIVAGALQDYERATLVGETTFGKGAVQTIYDLSDGSSLHVTSAIWLTPDGHQITGQGLTPDVAVPAADGLHDPQLDRAVEILAN